MDIREKLLKVIPTINWCETCKLHQVGNYTRKDCVTYSKRECAYEKVILDQILAIIQEAGWKPPTKKVCQGCPDRFEGCVKLADDQSLPPVPEKHKNYPGYMSPCNDAWQDGYKWLRKQLVSWRKVELEVKDGTDTKNGFC